MPGATFPSRYGPFQSGLKPRHDDSPHTKSDFHLTDRRMEDTV
jgi:hypothetical protein